MAFAVVVVVLRLHTFAFSVTVGVDGAEVVVVVFFEADEVLLVVLAADVLLLVDLADVAFVEAEVEEANLATVGKLLFSTPSRRALCPCLEKPGVTLAAAACKNLC